MKIKDERKSLRNTGKIQNLTNSSLKGPKMKATEQVIFDSTSKIKMPHRL